METCHLFYKSKGSLFSLIFFLQLDILQIFLIVFIVPNPNVFLQKRYKILITMVKVTGDKIEYSIKYLSIT